MQNRKNINMVLQHCIEQRRILPEISGISSNNYEELDEQIILLNYCLENGIVPFMDRFTENETNTAALWGLELNTFYDCVLEENE